MICVAGAFFTSFSIAPEMLGLNKYDYSGTNSLYIEMGKDLKFHWITNSKDIGSYQLLSKDLEVISSGNTEASRVHNISLKNRSLKDLTFKFGGIEEEQSEVRLNNTRSDLKTVYRKVDSIFVIGDIHGEYDALIRLLKKSLIVDENLNWTAGKSHVVFLGDVFDRGEAVTRVLWFIYGLEQQAEAAKGKVHMVLGNHEIMAMGGDLRYVNPKEKSIAIAYKTTYDKLYHPKNSLLGRWLSHKPSVLKIDQFLFAHGGIVDLGTSSLIKYNTTVSEFMQDPLFLELVRQSPDSTQYDAKKWYRLHDFFYYDKGPFWFRGYVTSDTLQVQLDQMLKRYRSEVHIVAHTRCNTITERYNRKLFTTDLYDEATELLFIKRDKNSFETFKIDSSGEISELP